MEQIMDERTMKFYVLFHSFLLEQHKGN